STFHPKVILLDIGLPGLDGYSVAQKFREQPETRDVLLIALTGYGQPEDRERSKAAGFDYHLVKPVDYHAIEALIDSQRVFRRCIAETLRDNSCLLNGGDPRNR